MQFPHTSTNSRSQQFNTTAQQTTTSRLTFADLPQVLAIERRSYKTPWSLGMFVMEVSKSEGLSAAARSDSQMHFALTGFAIVSKFYDTFHLMNICVDPERRREGIARSLLSETIERAGGPEARLTLEVRPTNGPARRLYEEHGFVEIGKRHRYYRDDGEDALILWRTPGTLSGVLDDIPGFEGPRKATQPPVKPDLLFQRDRK